MTLPGFKNTLMQAMNGSKPNAVKSILAKSVGVLCEETGCELMSFSGLDRRKKKKDAEEKKDGEAKHPIPSHGRLISSSSKLPDYRDEVYGTALPPPTTTTTPYANLNRPQLLPKLTSTRAADSLVKGSTMSSSMDYDTPSGWPKLILKGQAKYDTKGILLRPTVELVEDEPKEVTEQRKEATKLAKRLWKDISRAGDLQNDDDSMPEVSLESPVKKQRISDETMEVDVDSMPENNEDLDKPKNPPSEIKNSNQKTRQKVTTNTPSKL
jgi:hypothetical protein